MSRLSVPMTCESPGPRERVPTASPGNPDDSKDQGRSLEIASTDEGILQFPSDSSSSLRWVLQATRRRSLRLPSETCPMAPLVEPVYDLLACMRQTSRRDYLVKKENRYLASILFRLSE